MLCRLAYLLPVACTTRPRPSVVIRAPRDDAYVPCAAHVHVPGGGGERCERAVRGRVRAYGLRSTQLGIKSGEAIANLAHVYALYSRLPSASRVTSHVIVANVSSRLPAACLDARAYGAMSRAQSNINARTRIAPRTHSPVGVDLAPRAVSLGAEGPTARVESIINHRIRRQSPPRNRSHHHRTRRPPPRLRQSS